MPEKSNSFSWCMTILAIVTLVAAGFVIGGKFGYWPWSLFLIFLGMLWLTALKMATYFAGAYEFTRSADIKPGEYPVKALWRVHPVTHIVLKHGEAIDGWYRIYEIQSDLLPSDLKEGDTLVVQREKFKGRTYTSCKKKPTA